MVCNLMLSYQVRSSLLDVVAHMTPTLPVGVAEDRLKHLTPDAFSSTCVKLIQDTIDCSRITYTLKLSKDLFQTTQMPNPNRKQVKLSYNTSRQSKQQN